VHPDPRVCDFRANPTHSKNAAGRHAIEAGIRGNGF
jgi:hypothetical protein